MHLIFEDDDAAIVSFMDNQFVGRLKCNVVNIAPESSHQVRPPPNYARPAEVIENLVDGVVGHDVEEVLAINEVPQRAKTRGESKADAHLRRRKR
jgi:hypothetical protein